MELQLLLVEDDPVYERLVRKLLAPEIKKIHTATTMQAARTEIGMNNFDVIVLDLGLPDSSRAETIAAIKPIKETQPEATLIVVTGHEDMKEKAMEAGADGFLSKQTSAEHRAFITAIYAAMQKKNGGTMKENLTLFGKIAKS